MVQKNSMRAAKRCQEQQRSQERQLHRIPGLREPVRCISGATMRSKMSPGDPCFEFKAPTIAPDSSRVLCCQFWSFFKPRLSLKTSRELQQRCQERKQTLIPGLWEPVPCISGSKICSKMSPVGRLWSPICPSDPQILVVLDVVSPRPLSNAILVRKSGLTAARTPPEAESGPNSGPWGFTLDDLGANLIAPR